MPPLSHDSLPLSAFFFLIWSDVLGVLNCECVTAHFFSRLFCRLLLCRRHAPAMGNCPGACVRGEMTSTSNSHVHSHRRTGAPTPVHVRFFTLLIAAPVFPPLCCSLSPPPLPLPPSPRHLHFFLEAVASSFAHNVLCFLSLFFVPTGVSSMRRGISVP